MVEFYKNPTARALTRGGQSDPRRFIGQSMLANALAPQTIRHPAQGFAQMLQGAVAAKLLGKAQAEEEAKYQGIKDTYTAALRDALGRPAETERLASGETINWNPQEPGGLEALIRTLGTNPDTAGVGLEVELDRLLKEPEEPFSRTRVEGDQEIFEEFDPASNDFVEVSRGPRFKPEKTDPAEQFEPVFAGDGKTIIGQRSSLTGRVYEDPRAPKSTDGDLTAPQIASNAEIDNARQALTELQRSLPAGTSLPDELNRRMSQFDPLTGFETPDYNSYWGRLGWLAMQSKTGGDPEVGRWTNRLMPVIQPTAPAVPETAASVPSEEGGGFFENLFPRSATTAAPTGPAGGERAPATSVTPRGRMTPRGFRPARSPAPPAIESLSLEQLDELVNTQGDTLSPADLQRIEARLNALERTPQGRFPR